MRIWLGFIGLYLGAVACGGESQRQPNKRSSDQAPALSLGGDAQLTLSGLLHHVYGPNRETTGFAIDQGGTRVEVDLRSMGFDPQMWANQIIAVHGYWTVVHGDFLPNRWIVVATDVAPLAADLRCSGTASGSKQNLDLLAYKNPQGQFSRVILESLGTPSSGVPQTLADYSQHKDTTPPPPSDIRFRYLFSNPELATGDYIIELTSGGFTDQTTAHITQYDLSGNSDVGHFTCMALNAAQLRLPSP